MFMDDHSFSQAAPSALFQGEVYSINCDNPFLSAQQAGALCGAAAGTDTSRNTFIGYRMTGEGSAPRRADLPHTDQIGRASCRERGCKYVYISGVAGSLKKTKTKHTQDHNYIN